LFAVFLVFYVLAAALLYLARKPAPPPRAFATAPDPTMGVTV
jgi:hypothetical protein